MPRVFFIEHDGARILFEDFSGVRTVDEAQPLFDEAMALVRQQAPQSLLILTDVTGSRFDTEIVGGLKELARHNTPYVVASAVVGLTPLMRVINSAINRVAGRNIRAFDDAEDARSWLASQRPTPP